MNLQNSYLKLSHKFILTFLIAIFIFSICSNSSTNLKRILYLTDLHLNHFYDSNENIKSHCINNAKVYSYILNKQDFGKLKCDSNINLLNSLLDDFKINNKKKLDLIIIGGDSIFHGIDEYKSKFIEKNSSSKNEAKEIFKIIKNKILEKLNNDNIIYVPGNNDFIERYSTPEKNSLQDQVKTIREIFLQNLYDKNKKLFNVDFDDTLNKGFYYTYDFSNKVRFIIMNTVFFSVKNNGVDFSNPNNSAVEHFNWIENQIKKAAGENKQVILLGHIPAYLNYYENKTEFSFRENFSDLFTKLLYVYKKNILYYFSSHCHLPRVAVRFNIENNGPDYNCRNVNTLENKRFLTYESMKINQIFKFSEVKKDKNYLFYAKSILFPSLSPIFSNHPGYSVLEFDLDTNHISDIEIKFFNMGQSNLFLDFLVKNNYSTNNYNSTNLIVNDYINKITLDNKNSISTFQEKTSLNLVDLEEKNRGNLLKLFWNTKFSFRNDFKFDKFDSADFSDFIFSRLYKDENLNKYLSFMMGYNQVDYKKAIGELTKNGMLDEQNNYLNFRKIFYKIKNEDCDLTK